MAKLNVQARHLIREAGFTVAEFARMQGYADGKWGGDICGCTDTGRCANGFHHTGTDDCGCLPVLLDEAVAWRHAARHPNYVELVAPYMLSRWVNVTTPGVLATVSTTAGYHVTGEPEHSTVRIEPREGWTAEVTQQDGRIEVRIARAAIPAEEKVADDGAA